MRVRIAELGATMPGISTIVFLSVVPYGEVADHFAGLKTRHSSVSFHYFSKLVLFEGHHFDDLLKTLLKIA